MNGGGKIGMLRNSIGPSMTEHGKDPFFLLFLEEGELEEVRQEKEVTCQRFLID